MPFDAPKSGSHAGDLADMIRAMPTPRDRVSLGLDALRLIAPAEWLPLLTALKEAREWEHDDEEAEFHLEEAARAASSMADDCRYRMKAWLGGRP